MAEVKKVAEKVPGWVERFLIPSFESRVRGAVRAEIGHLAKLQDAGFEAINIRIDSLENRMNDRFDGVDARFFGVDAKFDGMDSKFDGMNTRFDGVDAKFESLEKRMALVQDVADLKARLAAVEKRAA